MSAGADRLVVWLGDAIVGDLIRTRANAIRYTGRPGASALTVATDGAAGGLPSAAAPPTAAAAAAEHFVDELEINDYPSRARSKVLKKETLAALAETARVAVTVKGAFVDVGRKPLPGERKLYLQIEGPVEAGVRRAKRELHRALEEETLRVAAGSASAAAAFAPGSGLYTKF